MQLVLFKELLDNLFVKRLKMITLSIKRINEKRILSTNIETFTNEIFRSYKLKHLIIDFNSKDIKTTDFQTKSRDYTICEYVITSKPRDLINDQLIKVKLDNDVIVEINKNKLILEQQSVSKLDSAIKKTNLNLDNFNAQIKDYIKHNIQTRYLSIKNKNN